MEIEHTVQFPLFGREWGIYKRVDIQKEKKNFAARLAARLVTRQIE